jgi:hypothetical protein
MKTLGEKSVSSNLAVAIKLAYVIVALWFAGAVVLLPFGIIGSIMSARHPIPMPLTAFDGTPLTSWTLAIPYFLYELVAACGALTIVRRLQAVFDSFVADQPFAENNSEHLRRIWLTLVVIEIVRVAAFIAARALTALFAAADASPLPREIGSPLDLSRLFVIFVVLVLAEVFRRGTQLREESELTV